MNFDAVWACNMSRDFTRKSHHWRSLVERVYFAFSKTGIEINTHFLNVSITASESRLLRRTDSRRRVPHPHISHWRLLATTTWLGCLFFDDSQVRDGLLPTEPVTSLSFCGGRERSERFISTSNSMTIRFVVTYRNFRARFTANVTTIARECDYCSSYKYECSALFRVLFLLVSFICLTAKVAGIYNR